MTGVVRSTYQISVGGQDVSDRFRPLLIDLTVNDKAGTHADTASIKVDNTGGRVALPRIGDPVTITIGSSVYGSRLVFSGTVDEVAKQGSRSSGRTVTISAKSVDTVDKAKEPQQRHWDDTTVEDVLNQAGSHCGIAVECRDGLGSLPRKYVEMRDESFIGLGERIAREIGANFKINGDRATLTKRNAGLTGSVTAAWGVNLHSYNVRPRLGRPQFNETRGRFYDPKAAEWKDKTKSASVKDGKATISARFPLPDQDEADQKAEADKATTERDTGEGQVEIELQPFAEPDGVCVLATGETDIDGPYRIEGVTHKISRGGGTTTLELKARL